MVALYCAGCIFIWTPGASAQDILVFAAASSAEAFNRVIKENPVAIHGVQHIFHHPVRLAEWPTDDHDTRIVFITRDLGQNVIRESLEALQKAAQKID